MHLHRYGSYSKFKREDLVTSHHRNVDPRSSDRVIRLSHAMSYDLCTQMVEYPRHCDVTANDLTLTFKGNLLIIFIAYGLLVLAFSNLL